MTRSYRFYALRDGERARFGRVAKKQQPSQKANFWEFISVPASEKSTAFNESEFHNQTSIVVHSQ